MPRLRGWSRRRRNTPWSAAGQRDWMRPRAIWPGGTRSRPVRSRCRRSGGRRIRTAPSPTTGCTPCDWRRSTHWRQSHWLALRITSRGWQRKPCRHTSPSCLWPPPSCLRRRSPRVAGSPLNPPALALVLALVLALALASAGGRAGRCARRRTKRSSGFCDCRNGSPLRSALPRSVPRVGHGPW